VGSLFNAALRSASFGKTTGSENSATGKVWIKASMERAGGAMAGWYFCQALHLDWSLS
jgi:hypothetical protein